MLQWRQAWRGKHFRQREQEIQKQGARIVCGRIPDQQVNEEEWVGGGCHQKVSEDWDMECLGRIGPFMLCDMGKIGDFCTEEWHALIYILTTPKRPTLGQSVRAFFKRCTCSELKFLESKELILHFSFLSEPKLSASSSLSWSSTDVYWFTHCSYLGRVVHWLTYQQRLMDAIRKTVGLAPVFTHWRNGKSLSLGRRSVKTPFAQYQSSHLLNICRNS